MATDDDHTTDKHDESDTAQFGDDPHNLNDTPFEETSCNDCGTYVVKAKGFTGTSRCLSCARNHAGVLHASGTPIGEWHPVVDFRNTTTHTSGPVLQVRSDGWHWGCLYCRETGTAINNDHAIAMHKLHIGNACPATPGLTPTERRNRLARRAPLTNLYPHTTPPLHITFNNGGWKLENPQKGKPECTPAPTNNAPPAPPNSTNK